MKNITTKLFLILFLLNIIVILSAIKVNATDESPPNEEITNEEISNEELETSYKEMIENLKNEIGEKTVNELFEDLKNEISKLKDINLETIKTKIEEISNQYGISFTEEQKEIIAQYYNKIFNEEGKTFLNSCKILAQDFWSWVKSLWNDSEIKVEPIEPSNEETNDSNNEESIEDSNGDPNNESNEKEPIEEENDDTTTITIEPIKVSTVDKIIDKLIIIIKNWLNS